MKKIFTFFLIFITLFTICGCRRVIKLKDDPASVESVTKIGSYIKKANIDFNDVSFKKTLNESLDKIYDAKDYNEIYTAFYAVIKKVNELVNKYYVAEVLVSYDQENSEYKEKYDILKDSYYEYQTFYNKALVEISKNDEFINQFFDGYSAEDIEFEVNMAKKKIDDEYINLNKEIDDLVSKANKIGIDFNSAAKDDELLEIMLEFINKNKQMAELLGFDSYVEYADLERNRSYLQSDVNDFIKYTKQYIVPLMNENEEYIDVRKYFNTLTYQQQSYFREFSYSSVFDKDYYTLDLLKDYAKNMGGAYFTTFAKFLNNGYYVFADGENSLDSAYTQSKVTYFGPNYQDCTTVAHEFGHYYSLTNSLLNTKSLDLMEFYSQANEYLFTSYLQQHSGKNVKDVYDVRIKDNLDSAARTIVISSALREFEQKIYSETLTTKEDIKDIWNSINSNNYKGYLRDYWKAEIRYDLYYLSYGTSVTGAISLYNLSKTDYRSAKNKYVKAVNNSNIDDDISEVLINAELYSPFNEQVFKDLEKLLKEE